MGDLYVLVHGGWHTGAELEAVASHLRQQGHVVHCPTIAGNRSNDDRETIGLEQAISSIIDYIEENKLQNIRLVGHSYGGMVISGVADRLANQIARIVYVNAFVPLNGQSLVDMVPPQYAGMFDAIAAANKNAVMLPFEIWREVFINDASIELAQSSYAALNPHPYRTLTDKITLKQALAELPIGKSYVNCRQDTALPHSSPWHPRLSERLGLFRLVECDGSHEMLFSNPARLAQAIAEAGRD
ncbi:alpha/beta hydrolase [Bradyrhizobium sp. 14AA]